MRIAILALLLACGTGLGISSGQMAIVNGASFNPSQPLAPGSFATIFGQNLCGQTAAGTWISAGVLPTTLGGCSVDVSGSHAMMHYVSPGQVNFIMPSGLMPGMAPVTVHTGTQTLDGSVEVASGAPGIFAMNGMGLGQGAMLLANTSNPGPFSVTTSGQTTYVEMFVTGLDLSQTPVIMVGGISCPVAWFGNAPGYAGLQQINITLPAGMAGAGEVPVTVSSGGNTSNVTFMGLLPTNAMMQGMPGWGSGMMVNENMPSAHEVRGMAVNPVNHTALIADRNDDVVRVMSLASNNTVATVTLPSGSHAEAVAVSEDGKMAAVALTAMASVALIDLTQNQAVAVVGTGYYPASMAFSGTNLLVANGGGESVSVIDTGTRAITQSVSVAFGPSGMATGNGVALVAGMQSGQLSMIHLSDYSVSNITLPAGSFPAQVAISTAANKAIITNPIFNNVLILDLASNQVTPIDLGAQAMGPGAVVTNGTLAYIANQMSGAVTVVDLNAGKVTKTFAVDPGPCALGIDPSTGQLVVLAEGTGTLDLIDMSSYGITGRMDAGLTERQGSWTLPLISSMTPTTATVGSSLTLTITGSNLQAVNDIEFHVAGGMMGGGGMGGSGMGIGAEDAGIKVSNVQASADGTRLTATVQISSSAATGTHQVRLETAEGEVMGMMLLSEFNVTQ